MEKALEADPGYQEYKQFIEENPDRKMELLACRFQGKKPNADLSKVLNNSAMKPFK